MACCTHKQMYMMGIPMMLLVLLFADMSWGFPFVSFDWDIMDWRNWANSTSTSANSTSTWTWTFSYTLVGKHSSYSYSSPYFDVDDDDTTSWFGRLVCVCVWVWVDGCVYVCVGLCARME